MVAYAKEREAFGKPIGHFQHIAFRLVEMATEVQIGQTFLDNLISNHIQEKTLSRKCPWQNTGWVKWLSV
jgi:acyl-CoA dehydrogenase